MRTLSSSIFVVAVLAILCMAGSAQATTALDISGVSRPVGVLDLSPGSSIAVDAYAGVASGTSFPLYYQAQLGSYLDTNGHVILGSGLNTSYEITVVLGFSEFGTFSGAIPTGGGNVGSSASFTFDPLKPSFVQVYKDPLMDANNLAGTGFTNGTQVLSGHVIADGFSSSFFSPNNVAINPGPYPLLDGSPNGNDWGNQLSVNGSGGTDITVKVDSFDPTFFTDPIDILTFKLLNNTSNNLPFNQVDPSMQFWNGTSFFSSVGTLGPINGLAGAVGGTGPNIMFQADANASAEFATGIPEPSTFVLSGLGLLIAGGLMRRRRRAN